MGRLVCALLALTASVVACSSGSGSSSAEVHSPSPVPSSTTSTPSAPRVGFDLVYDTVSSSFTDGQVWIDRGGVATALPGHGYGLVYPIPTRDGRALLVKRLGADGDPSGGDIAVIGLTGTVLTVVPHSAGCFPGGWVSAKTVVLGCGKGVNPATWKAYVVGVSDGARRTIGPTDPGTGGALPSPDGKTIEWVHNGNTYFLPTTNNKPKAVLKHDSGGVWTSDARHLVGTRQLDNGKTQLYVESLDGSARRPIGDFDWQGDLSYAVSPDGTSVVMAGSADTSNNFWQIGFDGAGLRQLTSDVGGDPQPLP